MSKAAKNRKEEKLLSSKILKDMKNIQPRHVNIDVSVHSFYEREIS